MEFYSDGPAATEHIGEKLAERLRPGDVVACTGGLGMGKTAFARGLARGLGVTEPVTSPTYAIVNEYSGGRLPLYHFDLYRLSSSDELFDIGWDDYLAAGGVCCVEWSERAPEEMAGAIQVSIARADADENSRVITITGGDGLADLGL